MANISLVTYCNDQIWIRILNLNPSCSPKPPQLKKVHFRFQKTLDEGVLRLLPAKSVNLKSLPI